MEAFAYAHPATRQEALGLLGPTWDDAAVIAGGTDIISLMKEHVVIPKRVVSIRGITEWNGISQTPAGLRIGALVTFEQLRENAEVQKNYAALSQAAEGITSPQMRNMGTVGGDLCQRPRCWYFRNGFGLLAKDANGKSLVPNGENRYHAILGNSGPAYFVSPSSLGPGLVALNAKIHIAGPGGAREINVADFFVIPKTDDDREHALKPNEIVTDVLIPKATGGMRNASYEIRQRMLFDWPLATASVALRMDHGTVREASVVLGHVAPTPWPADAATKAVIGKPINEQTAAAAGKAAVADAKPLSRNGYKVQLASVAVKRALLAAAKEGA
jgi:xanthine dehydrogenase YagS FAD-binding subunit